jgi:hypothetical protein
MAFSTPSPLGVIAPGEAVVETVHKVGYAFTALMEVA